MAHPLTNRLAGTIPAVGWPMDYRPGWLRGDVIAGITLAAYLMPAGIGDASLAGLPPEAGLYACLFSGLVFWLFTDSLIDLAGIGFLTELREALRKRGIQLRLAETHSRVRESLRRGSFEKHYGTIAPDQTVDTVIESIHNTTNPRTT